MAIVLAAAVSLPALFVADGYVSADYTVDQRAQESSSRLVAKKDVNSSALLAEQLYVVDDYYLDGYTDDPRRAEGYALIPATLVKDQDTIGIFPVSSTLAGPGLTQTAGAQADATSSSLSASFRIETTGMAASATSTTIMPFGMLEDAAAVSSQNKNAGEFYTASDYVVSGYVEDSSDLYSNSLAAAEIIRNGHFVPVASSATDIAVTQVHTVGAASEAVATHITAGSRIESTGMLSSATSTTLIPTTRVASTGYKSDATSATDIGSASIKSAGYKAEGTATTIVGPKYTVGFGVKVESQSTALAAGKMTAVFGVKVEATGTTIIASRLKWEPVEEPTDIWTTINDDSYPFG